MNSKNGIAKHTVEGAPEKGAALDAAIIAQYQRMTHYGITGFGTVAVFYTKSASRPIKTCTSSY